MPYADATLSDVYTQGTGEVFISGIQALVRLPLIQIARDRKAGLNTAGFISGYRGSPLGGYDLELQRAHAYLDAAGVVVRPAINEELAATAIWGTQQLELSPGHSNDGVFGIWYGKGPGADRTGDALKHGNAAGSSQTWRRAVPRRRRSRRQILDHPASKRPRFHVGDRSPCSTPRACMNSCAWACSASPCRAIPAAGWR